MTGPKPIETHYAGCRFRSRLEARWAVAFDAMGIPWEYEPQGFVLPSGRPYLPDFRLTLAKGPFWVEVKPQGGDTGPFEEFMGVQPWPVTGTVLHNIPDLDDWQYGWAYYRYSEASEGPWRYGTDDQDGLSPLADEAPYQFCQCQHCGAIGFEYEGRAGRLNCCDASKAGDESVGRFTPSDRIREAFIAARSARFEHGEHGNSVAFRRLANIVRGLGR